MHKEPAVHPSLLATIRLQVELYFSLFRRLVALSCVGRRQVSELLVLTSRSSHPRCIQVVSVLCQIGSWRTTFLSIWSAFMWMAGTVLYIQL